MKKIVGVLVLFLTACNAVDNYDTEFKNPVFNQPLRPLSSGTGYVHITPTSADFRGVLNKNTTIYKGKCDLIENKQDRITLKCKGTWDDGTKHDSYLTYIIKEIPEFIPGCLRILGYDYNRPEDFPKDEMFADKYCVTPPDYIKSESN